jgi:hypothetical protein
MREAHRGGTPALAISFGSIGTLRPPDPDIFVQRLFKLGWLDGIEHGSTDDGAAMPMACFSPAAAAASFSCLS